jgi:hypothetical protein
MQPVQVVQCGICKAFHVETTGPCPDCQAHRIYQLTVDDSNYPVALRQLAQRLRKTAEAMEREAAALEAKMGIAVALPRNDAAERPEDSTMPEARNEPTRRSA